MDWNVVVGILLILSAIVDLILSNRINDPAFLEMLEAKRFSVHIESEASLQR